MSLHVQGLSIAALLAAAAGIGFAAPPAMYGLEFVSVAAGGYAMNEQGVIVGKRTLAVPAGCNYLVNCSYVTESVVWSGQTVVPLPLISGYSTVTAVSINANGWVAGYAGDPTTTGSRAVVWKPSGTGYTAINLGVLPNTNRSYAAGIDDLGRVVGWTTDDPTFPTNTAPFVWTEAGGMVDLKTQGFPNEWPLAISPGGTVATIGYWYRLGDPSSVRALAPPPPGFSGPGNYPAAINDAGDQARFQITTGGGFYPYHFRYHHTGTWQQIAFSPCGTLSVCGIGGISAAGDITATVTNAGFIAYGPNGLGEPLGAKISPAYGSEGVAVAGPITASGQILANVSIGLSSRLVRLTAAAPCSGNCSQVAAIQMTGKMNGFPRGQCTPRATNTVTAALTVTNASGTGITGATVSGRFMDEKYLNAPVTATTGTGGKVTLTYKGQACVGTTSILIDGVTKSGTVLDVTTGQLAAGVIPKV